jgi:hypothetical protein
VPGIGKLGNDASKAGYDTRFEAVDIRGRRVFYQA